MIRIRLLLAITALVLVTGAVGCQSAYFATMEKFGYA